MALRPDYFVATLSELVTLHVAELADGCDVWVITEGMYFSLVKTSGAVADNINIFSPIPGSPIAGAAQARWIRNNGSALWQLVAGRATLTGPARINGTTDTEQLQINTPAGAVSDLQTWRRNNVVVADITSTGAIEANAISFQNGTSGGNTIAAIVGAVDPTAATVVSTANAIATLAARLNLLEGKISGAGTGIGVTA